MKGSDYISDSDKKIKPKQIKKGFVLLKPNDSIHHVWFLRKGYIRQYSISANGDEVTIHIFRPGSLLPLMLLFPELSNRFYFVAATDIEVQEFNSRKIYNLIRDNPALLHEFTTKFSLAINSLSLRIEMLSVKKTREKILLFLDYFAKQFAKHHKKRLRFQIPFNHSEIASWVGLRRETVSREISKLTKAGLISIKKGFITIEKPEMILKENRHEVDSFS